MVNGINVMKLSDKVQSTKLGVLAAAFLALREAEAEPWCFVAVAIGYMVTNAFQNFGGVK
jgi:hypothetical protein